jgi:hypothetical protein
LVSVVVVDDLVVSAGAAAGLVVSAGGGVAGAVAVVVVADVVEDDAESVLGVSPLPLPQDATKRPNERAITLNFTNFILLFLDGYACLYSKRNKVTQRHKKIFKNLVKWQNKKATL